MNLRKPTTIKSIAIALTIPLILMFFTADAECAQARQKSSNELLLEIMDLHSELVTNEIFLAQAKMLGAYLEAAQPLDESKKIKIYGKILNILSKIKGSQVKISESFAKPESGAEQKTFEGEQGAKSVYEPGAALLEIYKIDPDKKEIPELPVIRTYWKRDLAHGGGFLVPDRVSEIGKESPYLAKFSFYYEAKQSGRYGFTVVNKRDFRYTDFAFGKKGITFFKLTIGGVDVVQVSTEPAGQGVCNLKKGFHRVEFWLSAYAKERGRRSAYAGFDVKVLAPGAFDAVPITKAMILLKKE